MSPIVKPNFVPGKGSVNAKIAFIGEAPGADEDRLREPFIGSSGKLLRSMCATLNVPWESIYKTNVIKYRPPQNNFWRFKEVGVNLRDSVQFLNEEITSINPACCVIFGANATKVLLEKSPIRSWRGSILWGLGRKVVPTIHPAHILHQQGGEAFKYWLKYIIQFDIGRAVKQSQFKEYMPPKRLLEVCKSSAQLASFRERFKNAEYLSIDIEGYGKKGGGTGLPSCVSLSYDPHYAISVPLYYIYPGSEAKTGISQYDLPEVWYLLAKFLAEDKVRKVGQNFKYDEEKLNGMGMPIHNLYADTMLLQHTLYPEFWQSLAFMTSLWTEEPYYKDDGKSFDPSMSKLDQLYTYNARDAAVTLEVFLNQLPELREFGLTDWFFNFVMKLHRLYSDIESVGFRVDEDRRLELIKKYTEWEAKVHYDIYKAVGHEVNVASPRQVKKLLYEEMELPVRKGRAKSSEGGTGEDVLSGLLSNVVKDEKQKEVLTNILLERRIRKTLGPQYITALPDYDGRMRTSVFITGTETNRTSNQLQQPPVRPEKMGMSFQTLTKHGDVGQDVRTFLCPSKGFVLVNVDSMQAEARVVALLANDEDTLRMMDEIDIHALTASWSFGGTWETHSKKANKGKETPERFIGKTGRHAGHLGIKKGELSKMVITQARKYHISISGFSEWKAGKFLDVFHKQCPNVRAVFHYGVEECLSKNNRTIYGTVPFGIDSSIGARRQFYERWGNQLFKEAYAYIPQQTVTDNTKAAMLRTKDRVPDIRIIGESHDSFCFEAPLGEWKDIAKIAYEEMARPISFKTCSLSRRDLVIPSEVEIGDNYKDMEPVDVMVE